MMLNPLIKVVDLASPCLTRPRGEEAYKKFRPLVEQSSAIDVDLDSADAPSSSFLDEFILKLQESNLLDRVTFVTSKERVRKRLAIIAGTRRLTLYFKPQHDSERRPVPKYTPSYEAEYEEKPASVGADKI